MSRTKDMTTGSSLKLILGFALPLILTNLGQQFYLLVDASIVGRGIGVKALASVGAADWSYWLVLWTIAGFTQGASIFVSRYFGEKNYKQLNKTIAMATILCSIIGVLLTVFGILLVNPVLDVLKTPHDIIGGARVYLITMISGTMIVMAYNLTASILRAFGDGKSPLIAMIISAVLNIFLDLLFVLKFKWGIFGAAFASVLSQLVSFVYCYIQIKKIDVVNFTKDCWRFNFHIIKDLTGLSLPLAVQYMIIALGGIILQSTINMQGSIFVAGYTAVNKLYGLLESSALSLGVAFSTFFSQNYGAGNKQRVRHGINVGIMLCISASVIVGLFVYAFGDNLLEFFIDANEAGGFEALEVAWNYLRYMLICLAILYLIYVYKNALQSVGVSRWSMISGISELVCRVTMGKILIHSFGVKTLYFIEPAAWVCALVFVMIPYYLIRNDYI